MSSAGQAMTIAIGAIVKNEAPYLLEWVAYHRMIGVDHFYIADNESTDGTSELLVAMQAQGWITRIPFPSNGVGPQMPAYRMLAGRYRKTADWMAFIDADEYIVLDDGKSLPEFLAGVPADVATIAVNWAIYGSSGARRRVPGLVTQRFTRRAEKNHPTNRHYKTLFRTDSGGKVKNPHHVRARPGSRAILADGSELTIGPTLGIADRVVWAGIRINHYVVKSREEFAGKAARGKSTTLTVPYHPKFFRHHDRNDVVDPMPAGTVAATRLRMEQMRLQMPEPAASADLLPAAPQRRNWPLSFLKRPERRTDLPLYCLHFFYEDGALDLSRRLADMPVEGGVAITGPIETITAVRPAIRRLNVPATLRPSENRGRDVRPFLQLLGSGAADGYEVLCKLHTKQRRTPIGSLWGDFLVAGTIGSPDLVRRIRTAFAQDRRLLLVGPKPLYFSGPHRSTETLDGVHDAVRRLWRCDPPAEWGFFGGTMFWARRQLFEPVLGLEEAGLHFEEERGASDGAMEHIVERLFGVLATLMGGRVGLVDVTDPERLPLEIVDAPGEPSTLTVKRTLRRSAAAAAAYSSPAATADK